MSMIDGFLRLQFSGLVGLAFSATLLVPQPAAANGRFPISTNVVFQPDSETHFLVPASFGLLVSQDGGKNFHWVCEETIGYGGTYDPDYVVSADGLIYATTFHGVQVSRDGACSFQDTEFYGDLTGGDNPQRLPPGYFVSEVEIASDGKVWAATSTSSNNDSSLNSNNIYVSTDGQTFHSSNNFQPRAWWKSLKVSQSNPAVVYAAGYEIATQEPPKPARALLSKTVDGGATWLDLEVDDFAFGARPLLSIEAVSPLDPNILYARVQRAREPEGDDIYRSSDGGVSWTNVLQMPGAISTILARQNGTVIVGMATSCDPSTNADLDAGVPMSGCVRTSPTGEIGTWTAPATEPQLSCVAERSASNQLFGCGTNWEPDNFALGSSDDDGQSWTPVMRFGDIAGPLSCAPSTIQHGCALEQWPALCVMLGICEADSLNMDAGVSPGPPTADEEDDSNSSGSCLGCQTGASDSLSLSMVIAMMVLIRFRRRRN